MKLKMLSGLPGSGKSTRARAIVKESGNAGRINRDDLRAMIFNSEWTGPRESVIVDCEKAIARVLLQHKMMPVIDDTNLTAKHGRMWLDFAERQEAKFEVETLKTSLSDCLQRDSQREKPVGEAIINRMALWNGMIEFGTKPIVLCDIDGTIADGTHREHHLEGRKDWKTYYSKLLLDTPIQGIIDRVNELSKTHMVIVVSGRPDTYQFETLAWLRKIAKIQFDHLFMRAGNDKREDSIVKKEILDHLPKAQIVKVFDDRPRVCRMWEAEGLDVEWCRGRDCPEF